MSSESAAAGGTAIEWNLVRLARLAGPYLELAKTRLCALVLVTTLVGYLLASGADLAWSRLGWTLLGTALASLGANALNQCMEAPRDARMERTRGRPLPSGRLRHARAMVFAVTSSTSGPLLLWITVNALTALLAAICLLLYVAIYTPLKTRTPLCTLVGAVVGAIPPVMGWTGATEQVGPAAWILAGILFCWQIPHFLALAWLYRDDYARGGFRMLPVADPTGRLSCRVMILYSLMLLPLGLTATLVGLSGLAFAGASLVLGGGLLALVLRLYRERTGPNARRVFLASVAYLPLLLGLMVWDRTLPRLRPGEIAAASAVEATELLASAPLAGAGDP